MGPDKRRLAPSTGNRREQTREKSRLRIFSRFALDLINISSETDLFWYVAREVVGKLGFVDCVIYLADPERNLLRQVAAIGAKNPEADAIANALEIPVGEGITGHVAETRQAIIVDDLLGDSRYIPDLVEARSEICVPLIVDDDLVGVIDSEDPRPGRFGPDDLEVLDTVAAMTSARLNLLRKDQALRESERNFRALFDTTTCGIGRTILEDGRVILANRKLAEIFGYDSPEEFIETFVFSDHYVDPDDRQRLMDSYRQAPGTPVECAFTRKDGSIVNVQAYARANYESGVLNFVAIDISGQVQMESELRRHEALVQALIEHSPVALSVKDLDGRYLLVSPAYGPYLDMAADEAVGKRAEDILASETMSVLAAADRAIMSSGEALPPDQAFPVEFGPSTLLVTKFPIEDSGGEITAIGTVGIDVTEQVRVEDRLRQAQKMEAVGQLTGGIAHDFNNLLAVIQGNIEMLELRLGRDDPSLGPILRAAGRGAELTQRLLAYSRQQPLRPRPTDMAGLTGSMKELLRRTLGATIEVEIRAGDDLAPANVDPGQVENALLNLALNARDAMPGGGKLTIECANARLDETSVADNPEAAAGDYVVLSVSDEGTGMSADVRARVFEPFFTTKEVGKGSGLGLSMVYGFARQSGGHVSICSEEGKGTTVRLYMPRSREVSQQEEARPTGDAPRGKGEMILVIEDDPDVRALSVQLLENLDYRVIDVPDAAAALDVLASGTLVNLVLSDVVLPGGTSGPEFAVQARERFPGLGIIFMSGYPAEAAMRNGFLGPDSVLLNKPFERLQLARALRQALD